MSFTDDEKRILREQGFDVDAEWSFRPPAAYLKAVLAQCGRIESFRRDVLGLDE